MINVYAPGPNGIERHELGAGEPLPDNSIWIDLAHPTPEERALVERALGVTLPSVEEMREIETSSRFYEDGGALYMTTTVIAHADSPQPVADVVSFILVRHVLITLREADPRPFQIYSLRFVRTPLMQASGEEAAIGLLETFVDRIADIIEALSLDLDKQSRAVFYTGGKPRGGERQDLRDVIRALGRDEDIGTTARESLVGIARMIRYLGLALDSDATRRPDHRARLRTLRRDIDSLNEYIAFESQKIQFVLNATLGMINIEQNAIIKIFSVVAVVFLPPTLVASIYGMNFEFMPELGWFLGYPWALILMGISAILPWLYFKRKGWL
ncbi:MAG TPA: magnesium transporter CorA family protein [Alphaproteobacteria bacterium]